MRAEKSIGTLGGGNHFIEVDRDDEGNLYTWWSIPEAATWAWRWPRYYQEAGYKVLNGTDDATVAGACCPDARRRAGRRRSRKS